MNSLETCSQAFHPWVWLTFANTCTHIRNLNLGILWCFADVRPCRLISRFVDDLRK